MDPTLPRLRAEWRKRRVYVPRFGISVQVWSDQRMRWVHIGWWRHIKDRYADFRSKPRHI